MLRCTAWQGWSSRTGPCVLHVRTYDTAPRCWHATAQVEREHWTMSVMGVVHIIQGEEKEAEFMELGEWIR